MGDSPPALKRVTENCGFQRRRESRFVDPDFGPDWIDCHRPLLIEELIVDHTILLLTKRLQSAIHTQSEIVLTQIRGLEINYTGISFINSGQVKFKYKLEGLDQTGSMSALGGRRITHICHRANIHSM